MTKKGLQSLSLTRNVKLAQSDRPLSGSQEVPNSISLKVPFLLKLFALPYVCNTNTNFVYYGKTRNDSTTLDAHVGKTL